MAKDKTTRGTAVEDRRARMDGCGDQDKARDGGGRPDRAKDVVEEQGGTRGGQDKR